MKRIFYTSIICFGLLFTGLNSQAQSIDPTQNYSNPLATMPTLTGWHGGLGAFAGYRNQWPGIPATQVSYNLGFDEYFDKIKSGIGINLRHERVGTGIQNQNHIDLHWSPKIVLGDHTYLSPVLTLNYFQLAIDWTQTIGQPTGSGPVIFNMNDLPTTTDISRFTFGMGAALMRRGLIVSAYSRYINEPDISFFTNTEARLPRIWQVNVAQRLNLGENWAVTPTVGFQAQGEFTTLDLGGNVQFKGFIAGAMYRWNDLAAFALGYEFFETMRITYSYDMTTSSLGTQDLYSHELTMRVLIFQNKNRKDFIPDTPIF